MEKFNIFKHSLSTIKISWDNIEHTAYLKNDLLINFIDNATLSPKLSCVVMDIDYNDNITEVLKDLNSIALSSDIKPITITIGSWASLSNLHLKNVSTEVSQNTNEYGLPKYANVEIEFSVQ